MLLYIHVPFCRQKCVYCAFYSVPLNNAPQQENDSLFKNYEKVLCREIAMKKNMGEGQTIRSIFFGGGTPSLLSSEMIEAILNTVAKNFSLASNAEITLEANPESAIRNNWLKEVRKTGVNRISFGVQSFFDNELVGLGRVHTVSHVEQCTEKARLAGFSAINMDLIWGLPVGGKFKEKGNVNRWIMALEKAVALKPEHISAYALTLEEDTPLFFYVEEGEVSKPKEEEERQMFFQGAEFLRSQGYNQYEVSNFSLQGCECQHNLGYWNGEDYIGVGPSAVGTVCHTRYSNVAEVKAWEQGINSGKPVYEIEEISLPTARKERLMLSLRTSQGLDLTHWEEEGGQSFSATCPDLLALLEEKGLIAREKHSIKLTRKGMFVSNEIISRFFCFDSLFE